MVTKLPPSRTADQFVVRLPEGMRDRIAELAKQNGRSMNTEIVQRLEWALKLVGEPKIGEKGVAQQPIAGALSCLITSEIKDLADESGVAFDEMLAKIFMAGLHSNAPEVFYIVQLPGATKEDMHAALLASRDVVRPDAATVLERLEGAPWAPEWMIDRMKAAADIAFITEDGKLNLIELKTADKSLPSEPPQRRIRTEARKAREAAEAKEKKPG